MYTYRYNTHWITTTDELTGYIERFDVTPEQTIAIEAGANPDEVIGVEDPYIPPPPPPEEEPQLE